MPILFSAALKREDYNQATTLHQKAMPNFDSKTFVIFAIVLVITLGTGIVLNQNRAIAVLVYLSALGISMYLLGKASNASNEEMWQQSTNLHDPYEGRISAQGIETRSPTYISLLKWEHFKYFLATDNIILLYISRYQFVILPRIYFATLEDWNTFTQEVESRIPSIRPPTWQSKSIAQTSMTGFLLITVLIIGIAIVFSF